MIPNCAMCMRHLKRIAKHNASHSRAPARVYNCPRALFVVFRGAIFYSLVLTYALSLRLNLAGGVPDRREVSAHCSANRRAPAVRISAAPCAASAILDATTDASPHVSHVCIQPSC